MQGRRSPRPSTETTTLFACVTTFLNAKLRSSWPTGPSTGTTTAKPTDATSGQEGLLCCARPGDDSDGSPDDVVTAVGAHQLVAGRVAALVLEDHRRSVGRL